MDRNAYPVLYSLVFGEGIVNDAVSIAILTAVSKIHGEDQQLSPAIVITLLGSFLSLFLNSLMLGVAVGLGSALIVRHVFGRHHDCDREVGTCWCMLVMCCVDTIYRGCTGEMCDCIGS